MEMATQLQQEGLRHARMPNQAAVLISSADSAWNSQVRDISATGVLVDRPAGWTGVVGDLAALDMLIGDDLHIHLEATVARLTEQHIGFAYARIPEDKETKLWDLLGGYADRVEPFNDE